MIDPGYLIFYEGARCAPESADMSFEISGLALSHGPKNAVQKLLLALLGDRADEFGICWPSRQYLMDRASISDSTLTRALRQLENDGWIQRRKRFNSSNLYRVNILRLQNARKKFLEEQSSVSGQQQFAPFPEEVEENKAQQVVRRSTQAIEKSGYGHRGHRGGHHKRSPVHPATTNQSITNQDTTGTASPHDFGEFDEYRRCAAPGQTFTSWKNSLHAPSV